MLETGMDADTRLMLSAAVYPAYDLAWQMEELLMEAPDLNKLASCVALLRVSWFVRERVPWAASTMSWLCAGCLVLPVCCLWGELFIGLKRRRRWGVLCAVPHTSAFMLPLPLLPPLPPRLLQMFARGSEGHVYTSLLLQQAYAQRVQELDKKVANMPRKTASMQRRLTQQINELLSGANLANMVYSEAVPCR